MKLKAFTMIAAMVAVGATARADRLENMSDGDAGSYWDIGGSGAFFGFAGFTTSYWGATITIPVASVSPSIGLGSVTILFDSGQFGGGNDPLSDDNTNFGVGDTLKSDPNSTTCTPVGTPTFAAGQTTTITCSFDNPFPPAVAGGITENGTAYYVVLGLTGTTGDTLTPVSGANVDLAFIQTNPNGTTSTPEPSAVALLGLVMAGALLLKRRLA